MQVCIVEHAHQPAHQRSVKFMGAFLRGQRLRDSILLLPHGDMGRQREDTRQQHIFAPQSRLDRRQMLIIPSEMNRLHTRHGRKFARQNGVRGSQRRTRTGSQSKPRNTSRQITDSFGNANTPPPRALGRKWRHRTLHCLAAHGATLSIESTLYRRGHKRHQHRFGGSVS